MSMKYQMLMGFHEVTTSKQTAEGITTADAIRNAIEEADNMDNWRRSDAVSDPFVIELARIEPDGSETEIPIPWAYSETGTVNDDKARRYDLEIPQSAMFRVEHDPLVPNRGWDDGWRVTEAFVLPETELGALSLEQDKNGFLDYEIERHVPCPGKRGWYVLEGVTGRETGSIVQWQGGTVRGTTPLEVTQAQINQESTTPNVELFERMELHATNAGASLNAYARVLAAALRTHDPEISGHAAEQLSEIEHEIKQAKRLCQAAMG